MAFCTIRTEFNHEVSVNTDNVTDVRKLSPDVEATNYVLDWRRRARLRVLLPEGWIKLSAEELIDAWQKSVEERKAAGRPMGWKAKHFDSLREDVKGVREIQSEIHFVGGDRVLPCVQTKDEVEQLFNKAVAAQSSSEAPAAGRGNKAAASLKGSAKAPRPS